MKQTFNTENGSGTSTLPVSTSRIVECEKVFPPAGDFVEDFGCCGVNSFSSVKKDILIGGAIRLFALSRFLAFFRKLWSDFIREKHKFCSAAFLLFEWEFSL